MVSASLHGLSSASLQEINKESVPRRKDSSSSASAIMPDSAVKSEADARKSVNLEVKRYPAYPATSDFYSFSSEAPKGQQTHNSSHRVDHERGVGGGGGSQQALPVTGAPSALTYQAQQHLRRLEIETKALRQKEEEERVVMEKHALAKQRIELEMQRTRKVEMYNFHGC